MSADTTAAEGAPAERAWWSVLNPAAMGAILIWSGTAPFSKYALREFPILSYIVVRPIVGVAILLLILAVRRQPISVDRADIPRLVLTGMFGIGLSQMSYAGALSSTSVAHTVVLGSVSPLLIAGYRLGIKRQKLPGRSMIGLLGGFLGVVILMSATGGGAETSLGGDALALLSAVTWMGATMWPAALIAKYGSLRASVWLFGSAFLLTLPLGVWSVPGTLASGPSWLAWGGLVYAAVFGLVVGNMLWQRAVQELGGAGTLVYLYLQPVGAMILAALFLGEVLSPVQAIGGALALAGVALVRRD